MKKRNKSASGGANWMDTYGDLVTLLLCFFVLLYSISTVDQAKWVQVVKSFNPNAVEVSQIAIDNVPEATDEVPNHVENGSMDEDEFDSLYEELRKALEEAGMEGEVDLYKGDGFTFVTFRDNVFFAGDSSIIKDEGKGILDQGNPDPGTHHAGRSKPDERAGIRPCTFGGKSGQSYGIYSAADDGNAG